MKYKLILLITFLLCTIAIVRVWTEGDEYADRVDTFADISASSIHGDLPIGMDLGVEDEFNTRVSSDTDSDSSDEPLVSEWRVEITSSYNEDYNKVTREDIINYAGEHYGVDYDWCVWLIGTTYNEDYPEDRYLQFCWACEIINEYRYWSIDELDCIWGEFYSIGNAYAGYYSADNETLQMVWEALVNTDTRIVEVDGMIRWDVPGYYLIYDSPVYNCQVWGE